MLPFEQSDPDNVQNIILELKRRVAALEQSYVHANSAEELVSEIGNLDYRAVDSQGRVRMIMSAVNLLAEYGIDAHFAGFDANGTPQIWLSADDGSLKAGGGAVTLNEDGILVDQGGDAIVFRDGNNYGVFSFAVNTTSAYKALRLLSAGVTGTNLLTNGNFETGDLSSWTETDPDSSISISALGDGYGGGYAVRFVNPAGLGYGSYYITQSIALSSKGVLARFRIKASSGFVHVYINGVEVIAETNTGGEWRTMYAVVPGSTSSIQVMVSGGAGGGGPDVYIDDIEVFALGSAGTNGAASNLDVMGNGIQMYTHLFRLKDINGNNVVSITTDDGPPSIDFYSNINIPTGKTYNINGVPHTHTVAGGSNSICDGRLTLDSTAPVTTTDQLAKTTVYFVPYKGNKIALYDGTSTWNVRTFTATGIAVPSTTSTPFDIFCYDNAGTPAFETVNWTNDTTRATALVLQDGVLVKSGATTRRYLGTGRTTTVSGQCEDSRVKRYLWNYYNRAAKALHYTIGTGSWTYATASWRQANANTAAQVEIVVGVLEDEISLRLVGSCTSSGTPNGFIGIGEDSTTAVHADGHQQGGGGVASVWLNFCATLDAVPSSVGRHYYAWLEYASAATITFYGGAGTTNKGGLNGSWLC